ncbi:MAG TPA: lamin tail domain-containing protein [Chitinophagales bacterium]|nr:lamin tail domain-containing protein [Chitinophagales bacterium]
MAEISTLPYTETFSNNFILGKDLNFLSNNWFGNEVSKNDRIFQTENKELGMIATSSFTPDVQARLNLKNYKNVALTFKAKSLPNQEGNKSSTLYISTSVNDGFNWYTERAIQVFENDTTAFKEYKYNIPGIAYGRERVLVRFLLVKEVGDGKSPIVIMDDIKFYEESSDNIPPEVDNVIINTSKSITVNFNEKVNNSATVLSNYQGLPNLSSIAISPNETTVTLNFSSDYGIGIQRTLTISNIFDKAGNAMTKPYVKPIIYNDLRPDIVITELMYNSPAEDDSLEFIEIYNKGTSTAVLGGLTFSKGITMTIPEYNLEVGKYVLLATNAKAAKALYGKEFLQWESGALNNGGETLEIKNNNNQVVTSVKYDRTWGGDANGHSISFCSTVSDPNLGNYWISTQKSTGKKINDVEIFASPGEGCANNIIPEIRFTSYSTYAFEGAKTIKVQIQLVYPNANKSEAILSIDNSSTATFGKDFTASVSFPYQLSFPADKNFIDIEIQVLDDLQKEGVESIIFNLSDPTNARIGGRGNYRIDILDNDATITQVCVNELVASNNSSSGIKDNFGDADDWIEIKNGGTDPITLSGYFVTDDPKNLTKYQLPIKDIDSLTIAPNGYLILWADKEMDQGVNHVNFALSASGEYFALVMPDGKTIVDEVTFPALETNTSYGREKDCDDKWIIFSTPTFKASNQPTSIMNRIQAASIILYPNPNSGTTIYISEPINYQVFDQMGRQLLRDTNSKSIDVSTLSSGMYYLLTDEGLSTNFIISR